MRSSLVARAQVSGHLRCIRDLCSQRLGLRHGLIATLSAYNLKSTWFSNKLRQ